MAEPEGVARTGAFFTDWAEAYQEVWTPVLHPWNLRLVGELPLAEAAAVLEIGAGTGALMPELLAGARPGARVVGVDRAEGMIRMGPRGPSYRLAVVDAAALPFAGASFDLALMPFMLFFVPDPAGALGEAARVLRRGGSIGVAVWGPDSDDPYLPEQAWTDELDRLGAARPEPVPRTDELMDSPGKLAGLLERAGFEQVRSVAEPFRWEADAEMIVRRYAGIGLTRRRLESLSPADRDTFLARVRDRLAELPADQLAMHDEVVMGWGRRPNLPPGAVRSRAGRPDTAR